MVGCFHEHSQLISKLADFSCKVVRNCAPMIVWCNGHGSHLKMESLIGNSVASNTRWIPNRLTRAIICQS